MAKTSAKRRARKETSKKDYRQDVTNKIIEAIANGVPPWAPGYDAPVLPFNGVTGRPYKGMNLLNLQMAAAASGFKDPRWMTYKQAEARGWQVRRGEKAVCVEYWDWSRVRKAGDDPSDEIDFEAAIGGLLGDDLATDNERRKQPAVYYAYVFNADQIAGVPKLDVRERDATEREKLIDAWVSATGANVVHQNPRTDIHYPHYSVGADYVYVPPKESFESIDRFHATTMHELGHWTGHESRLKRTFGATKQSPEYAQEELRAELASAMVCAELGIIDSTLDTHAAYIDSWVSSLKNDKNEIFRAARDAGMICDYLMQFAPQELLEYRQSIIDQAVSISNECEAAAGDTIAIPGIDEPIVAPRKKYAGVESIGAYLLREGWELVGDGVYQHGNIRTIGLDVADGAGRFQFSYRLADSGDWMPVTPDVSYASVEFEDADTQTVAMEIQHIEKEILKFLEWAAADTPDTPDSAKAVATPATKEEAAEALAALRPFFGRSQFLAIAKACRGEEQQFFFDRIVGLKKEIDGAPRTYDQDGKGDDAIVHFHYFHGGSDWYITELDKEDKGTEQAFGYVCLNGWLDSAEMGYICIDELVQTNMVELDLYWTPKTLGEVKRELHREHARDPMLEEGARKAEAEMDAARIPSGMAWDAGTA